MIAVGLRLKLLRERAGLTQAEMASLLGHRWQSGYARYERDGGDRIKDSMVLKLSRVLVGRGTPPIKAEEVLRLGSPQLVEGLAGDTAGLLSVEIGSDDAARRLLANWPTIPVFGHPFAGKHGAFPWSGEEIDRVPAPPQLIGVHDAYAVQIAGDSMEPRYYAGEYVYVHPNKAIARGAFVVIQVDEPGSAVPLVYVMQFDKANEETITVSQLSPSKTLTLPRTRVLFIHRIVLSGED